MSSAKRAKKFKAKDQWKLYPRVQFKETDWRWIIFQMRKGHSNLIKYRKYFEADHVWHLIGIIERRLKKYRK